MKATGALALAGICAALCFGGCATQQAPKMREDFRSILHDYNTQAYDQCLAEISTALQTRLIKGQRAQLLMIRGKCQEEMGSESAAKATYTLVKTDFDRTSFAEAAQRRLNYKDGDQREHIELDLNGLGWRRALKQWNHKGFRCFFFPVGENPSHHTAKLMLSSIDRPEFVKTLDDAEGRAEAEFSLRGGTVKRLLLEQSASERYLQVEELTPDRKEPSVSLSRVILTEDRLHCAAFTLRKPALTAEEREKYLSYLKSAKLIGDK